MTRFGRCASATLLFVVPTLLSAQNYRVRIDARGQAVSFRGLAPDSIRSDLAVRSANGGDVTPDGHAVRCGDGAYCYFFRPGAMLRGVPITTSASVAMWGLGVEGLSFHGTGRIVADVGKDDVWPATEPNAQLLEGFLEYKRSAVIARAGRQLLTSRLQSMGYDGGWLNVRWDAAAIDVTGYGGWGLGQAAVVAVSNPVLNPLDDWRPMDRQLVAGAVAAWQGTYLDANAEYRREIDPLDNYFVSERAAMSLGASVQSWRATSGIDYNIAEGIVGNADMALTYMHSRFSVTGGARRYRPYFSLWTLWGAFSPVPYHAVNASVQFKAASWLSLQGRGERYRYDPAEISTALVPDLEDRGWRLNSGATATLGSQWILDGHYGLEYGPGAAGRFVDGAVSWMPNTKYLLNLYAGSMARPLELRYFDAKSAWVGGRAEWQVTSQQRLWTDVAFVTDDRNRPDASAWNASQARVRAGLSLTFGSQADRLLLPPALPPAKRGTSSPSAAR